MRRFSATSLSSAWGSRGRTPVTHNLEASVFELLVSSSSRLTPYKARLFPPAVDLVSRRGIQQLWHDPVKYTIGHPVFPLPCLSLRMIQSLLHSLVRLINYFIRHRWPRSRSNVFLSTPRRIPGS
jgi:hypothetical protein